MSPARAGTARVDITPSIGVELCGYGAYLRRRSTEVRSRLWARALAVDAGGGAAVVVSCDLVGLSGGIVERARALFARDTGADGGALLVCCTHTHSGPNTCELYGWGEPDGPYRELLPARIARAAAEAWRALAPARFAYGEAPLEGLGVNREYDAWSAPFAAAIEPGWRPAKPELTDTAVRVLRVEADDGRLLAMVSHFGCHPVIGSERTTDIHGDWCGVGDALLEVAHPGAVAMFIQGAQGDINPPVVHRAAEETARGLAVLAQRYADAVEAALAAARPIAVDAVRTARREQRFARKPWTLADVEADLAKREAFLAAATDADDRQVRHETVYAHALRRIAGLFRSGADMSPPLALHGVRIGPLAILGSPFETFQAIKNDVRASARAPHAWVASFVDDFVGYACDRTAAARGGYAQDSVPLMFGYLPYASAHDDLVAGLTALDRDLAAAMPSAAASR